MKQTLLLAGLSLCITLALVLARRTSAPADVDIDMARLSTTLVYAQLSNMLGTPEAYEGKRIRMHGTVEAGGDRRYFCTVQDPGACCSLGMPFVLKDAAAAAPTAESTVTLVGTFRRERRNGDEYVTLADAVIEHQYGATGGTPF